MPIQSNRDPAQDAVPVTPHDTTMLTYGCRGLYIETGGDLVLLMAGSDTARTIAGVADGTLLPFAVRRVNSTGTTATGIHALY